MRWTDDKIYNAYLTEGKKKQVPIYKQIRKAVPPPGSHHGDKKKEDERKKARSKVDADSYEENYSISRKMHDVAGAMTRNTLDPEQQITYATHFEGGDDEPQELPRIGSKVTIADDAGGGTGNVVGHEGDKAVVELENEVVKLFNNFDIEEVPSDGI